VAASSSAASKDLSLVLHFCPVYAILANALAAFSFYRLAANNEPTMDILADQSSGAFLRNHPEIMLWAHITLSFCMEGLRSLRDSLLAPQATPENTDEEDAEKIRQQQLRDSFSRITTAIDFIERFYFAAFPSSQDAKEYLAANDKPVLVRH
jgi:hypothetical protein